MHLRLFKKDSYRKINSISLFYLQKKKTLQRNKGACYIYSHGHRSVEIQILSGLQWRLNA